MASTCLSNLFSLFSPSHPPPPPTKPKTLFAFPSPSKTHLPRLSLYPTKTGLASQSLPSDVASVLYPSLGRANTLCLNAGYNVQIVVEEDEPEEALLRRFRREVFRAGVIQECKRRRFFEDKHDKRKRKAKEASKRNKRRRYVPRTPFPDKQEASQTKKEDDEQEDNWDLPEGELPY
ncbi:hypothetical protein QJS10_CPA16g00272 [Acorus calamus]|uniref:30S ribosomal protein S21, chloroplastic n=1 Tax=Acorus calamus TaxID=4465 RepID=A0AAV9D0Y9_ACOCL|nr:hypothetical protein QJS10_CPA16g00272 [Acorus calamus]